MKRYLVTVQNDEQQEEVVILADSPKIMRKLIHKLYNQSICETEIKSYMESEWL